MSGLRAVVPFSAAGICADANRPISDGAAQILEILEASGRRAGAESTAKRRTCNRPDADASGHTCGGAATSGAFGRASRGGCQAGAVASRGY